MPVITWAYEEQYFRTETHIYFSSAWQVITLAVQNFWELLFLIYFAPLKAKPVSLSYS